MLEQPAIAERISSAEADPKENLVNTKIAGINDTSDPKRIFLFEVLFQIYLCKAPSLL
jgi:hypothetical protein